MSEATSEPPKEPVPSWRQLFTNPVVLGAILTAYVGVNTAVFGYITTKNSQQLERAKFEFEASLEERKYETSLLLEVVKAAGSDQQLIVRRLCALAETGLVPQFAERLRSQTVQPCRSVAPAKP
jgi:hypothetical protein